MRRDIRFSYVWFQGSVFGVGRSNCAIFGQTKSKMATGRQRGKLRMAIFPQRAIRSTSYSVIVYGFCRRRIEWRYFELDFIQQVRYAGENSARGVIRLVTIYSISCLLLMLHFMVKEAMVRKHNKPRPRVAHRGIARFFGIGQKCNQVVAWSLHTFPENFI